MDLKQNIGYPKTVVPQRFPKKHFCHIEPSRANISDAVGAAPTASVLSGVYAMGVPCQRGTCDAGRSTANGGSIKAFCDVKTGNVLELKLGEKLIRVEVLSTAGIVGKAGMAAIYQRLNKA